MYRIQTALIEEKLELRKTPTCTIVLENPLQLVKRTCFEINTTA